jgi:hypothetical protein
VASHAPASARGPADLTGRDRDRTARPVIQGLGLVQKAAAKTNFND